MLRFALLFVLLLPLACSEDDGAPVDPLVPASDFEQGCTYDDECTPIIDGDVCACTACPTAAVHQNDLSRFSDTVQTRQSQACPTKTCTAIGCGDPGIGYCDTGSCTLRQPRIINGEDFDQSCTVDEDCVPISEGEICQPCSCLSAAVSTTGSEAINAIRSEVECHNGDVLCEPCAQAIAVCSAGSCILQ